MSDRLALEITRLANRVQDTTVRHGTLVGSVGGVGQVQLPGNQLIAVQHWVGGVVPVTGSSVMLLLFKGTVLGSQVGSSGTGWTSVPFVGGWINHGTSWPGRYRRDATGQVFVTGLVRNPAAQAVENVIFTLPVGYRPSQELHLATVCNAQFHIIGVAPTGQVKVKMAYPANTWFSITCTFLAEQ